MPALPSRTDLVEILGLRLLICRAAAADSLRWWEDEALTEAGSFVLGRLFPRSARSAARRLALDTARRRHDAALTSLEQRHHLFDLGPEVEAALDEVGLDGLTVPTEPIPDLSTLATLLPAQGQVDAADRQGSVIRLDLPANSSVRQRVLALVAVYRAAEPGEPVFPVIVTGASLT